MRLEQCSFEFFSKFLPITEMKILSVRDPPSTSPWSWSKTGPILDHFGKVVDPSRKCPNARTISSSPAVLLSIDFTFVVHDDSYQRHQGFPNHKGRKRTWNERVPFEIQPRKNAFLAESFSWTELIGFKIYLAADQNVRTVRESLCKVHYQNHYQN